MKIKRLYRLRVAALWLLGLFAGCSTESVDPVLTLHPDEPVRLSDYRGKWLLINYWAIWCKPCREEVPELNRLHQADDIEVFAINFDRQLGDVLTGQARELGIAFPLLLTDPLPIFTQKSPSGLPATLVIGPDGQFRQWLMGPQDELKVRQALTEL